MKKTFARFHLGQPVHHKMFDYRAVVVDVDATFQGSHDWYTQMARSRPPKDSPWYHLLVHGGEHWTYVAERNLERDLSGDPIDHPDINDFFDGYSDGQYSRRDVIN